MIIQLVDNDGRLWSGDPLTITRHNLKPRSPIINDLVIDIDNQLLDLQSGIIIDSEVIDMLGIHSDTYVLLHNGDVIHIRRDNSTRYLTTIASDIELIMTDKSGDYLIIINSDNQYLTSTPVISVRHDMPSWRRIIMNVDGVIVTTYHIYTIDVRTNHLKTYPTPIGLIDITQWNGRLLGLTREGLVDIIDNHKLLISGSIRGFLRWYEVGDSLKNSATYFYDEDGIVHLLHSDGKTSLYDIIVKL